MNNILKFSMKGRYCNVNINVLKWFIKLRGKGRGRGAGLRNWEFAKLRVEAL